MGDVNLHFCSVLMLDDFQSSQKGHNEDSDDEEMERLVSGSALSATVPQHCWQTFFLCKTLKLPKLGPTGKFIGSFYFYKHVLSCPNSSKISLPSRCKDIDP